MSKRAILALTLGALAWPPSAAAVTVPITVTPVNPPNGGALTASRTTVSATFTVEWAPPPSFVGSSLFVEVTNQNIIGQDGTLANDPQYSAGEGFLSRGDADPNSWTGTVSGAFATTPGTYYFDFYAFGANADCGPAAGVCTLASPVFSFATVAPPPIPLPPQPVPQPVPQQPAAPFVWRVADARGDIRRAIVKQTHRNPSHLSRSCSRVNNVRFTCPTRWNDARTIWGGTFHLEIDPASGDVGYSFRGLRASRACLRTRTLKSCERHASF